MITHEQVTEILVQLAQLNERQKAMDEAGDHRHNNMKTILETLASKKDVDAANERIAGLKERVASLESNQARVVWGLLGTMASVVIQALGLTKKLGF